MKVIDTIILFPVLHEKLVSFLKALSPVEWKKQIIARKWMVKERLAGKVLDMVSVMA